MENEDLDLEKELEDDEALLNFDLDDISDEELGEEASDSEEDIIELVNLVEEGPETEISDDGEIADLIEETGSPMQSAADAGLDLGDVPPSGLEEEDVAEEEITEDDLSGLLEEEPGEEVSLDLEGEEGEAEEEITEDDFSGLLEDEPDEEVFLDLEGEEGAEPEEGTAEEEITEEDLESLLEGESGDEISLDLDAEEGGELEEDTADAFEDLLKDESDEEPVMDLGPLSGDEEPLEDVVKEIGIPEPIAGAEPAASAEETGEVDFAEEPAALAPEAISPLPAAGEGIGISEERLEAVVSRVVQEVVERVARETMADVAEKVITEAIEALKESLETSSD